MTLDEVEKAFGNLTSACYALGYAEQNVTQWRKQNYIPWGTQFALSKLKPELIPDEIDPKIARKENRLKALRDKNDN